ncbi:hypothetical protein [Antarcticimicrobium luteum]|uniref:Uncharacterized protein n=1 Tax=Antarcticimicrobium luteum TaxID=2547397 RepID=A0A4R5VFB5_9RHOB|nr:hypothetical protein [Antarcticimicrobium luteum]TDK51143.1 hypothetical protein E1832_04005 [Antarcticimicrobium luteum]
MRYIVKRPHQGDRWYAEGAVREADEREVAHLVANGVLMPDGGPDEGPDVAAAEGGAPADKAARIPETGQPVPADPEPAE